MRMSMIVIVVGSLAILLGVVFVSVFVPGFVWHPDQTLSAHPMTAEEYRGYTIYYQNQCWTCHTIYSRYWESSGYPKSQPGDYEFYMPVPLGSERTGPDLSDIGRKRSLSWEIEHYKSPRAYMPNSIMPNFYWMSDDDLHALSAFLFNKGDRVAGEQMIRPPAPYTGQVDPFPYVHVTPAPATLAQGWSSWMAADLQKGKELYIDRCVDCHGCAGNGLGYYASKLFITPANFQVEPFRSMTDPEWFWHVSEGVPASPMPVWKMSDLTELQRWQIIRYIQQIFSRPIMRDPDEGSVTPGNAAAAPYVGVSNPLPLTVAVLEEGKAIYLRECMICHDDDGRGSGQYGLKLQPPPADFHRPDTYNSYSDADWFWRIREGLPWSAMPSWKIKYSEDDIWKLVHYIRVNFAQTEPRPGNEGAQFYPTVYTTQVLPPSGVTYQEGQVLYLNSCAKCHGLDGKGNGWGGRYLMPMPADFTSPLMQAHSDGDWFARVSLGVQNSAMPPWNEFLFEGQRWAAIKYVIEAFVVGRPVTTSQYMGDKIAVNAITLSAADWLDAGNTISPGQGQIVYRTYCENCHGALGLGNGPGTVDTPSLGPAPFPAYVDPNYAFWRTWHGVQSPQSLMPPFGQLKVLTEQDIWNVSSYVSSLTGTQFSVGG